MHITIKAFPELHKPITTSHEEWLMFSVHSLVHILRKYYSYIDISTQLYNKRVYIVKDHPAPIHSTDRKWDDEPYTIDSLYYKHKQLMVRATNNRGDKTIDLTDHSFKIDAMVEFSKITL